MTEAAAKPAVYDPTGERQCRVTIEAAARRGKIILRDVVAWVFAPPKLPAHPPIDYSQEPGAARAVRQRRVQAAVDDLLIPPSPDDMAHRWTPYY